MHLTLVITAGTQLMNEPKAFRCEYRQRLAKHSVIPAP